MQNTINAILNLILVSMPEELFLTVMTLIFIKRFDMLDVRMWRQNIRWIMIPTVSMALVINILKYYTYVSRPVVSLVSLIVFIILFNYIIFKNSFEYNKKSFFKIITGLLLSFVMLSISETIYIPIMLFMTKTSLIFFQHNVIYNFLLSIPSRIFLYSVVGYVLIKKHNTVKVNIFEIIVKNTFLKFTTITLSLSIIFSMLYVIKLIGINNILNQLGENEQIFISIIILAIPTILIMWLWSIINYIVVKEKSIRQAYENLASQEDILA